MTGKESCPCCTSLMVRQETSFSIHEIFRMWKNNGVAISDRSYKDYNNDPTVTLFKCPNCQYGVFLPMQTGTESFYSDITKADYYLDDRWDFHEAFSYFKNNKIQSIVDVGCGQGAFLKNFTKRFSGVACHGLDTNLEVEGLPAGISFHRQVDELPEKLDAITLFQVVEHVSDPFTLLNSLTDKIKSSGYLLISVPDYAGPVRFFEKTHTALPPHHVSQWNPECLKQLLKRLGFTDLEVRLEPLPDYLFTTYLPEMFSNILGVQKNAKWKYRVTKVALLFAKILKTIHIKSLPFRGHTCLVVGKKV